MDKELLNEINTVYYRLETKQTEICRALSHRVFTYPIPVIDVKGLCDIDGEQIFELQNCSAVKAFTIE